MKILTLKNRIMLRIYWIFLNRQFRTALFWQLLVFLVSVISIAEAVSLRNILANQLALGHDANATYHFWSSAIFNTKLSVKITTGTLLAAGLLILKDAFDYLRSISRNRFMFSFLSR